MDFKFLGLVGVVLLVLTGGAALPLLPLSVIIGIACLAFEGAQRLSDEYRRRDDPPGS